MCALNLTRIWNLHQYEGSWTLFVVFFFSLFVENHVHWHSAVNGNVFRSRSFDSCYTCIQEKETKSNQTFVCFQNWVLPNRESMYKFSVRSVFSNELYSISILITICSLLQSVNYSTRSVTGCNSFILSSDCCCLCCLFRNRTPRRLTSYIY